MIKVNSRIYVFSYLIFIFILFLILFIFIYSCSKSKQISRQLPQATISNIYQQIDIKTPNTDKNSRVVSENIIISGSDWFTKFGKSANTSINANLMMLEPKDTNDYSWASYRFIGLESYIPKSLDIKVAPYSGAVWYVAVANYSIGAWQWFGPFKTNSCSIKLDEKTVYVNNFNTTIVVVGTKNKVAIDTITLGSNSPAPRRYIKGKVTDENGLGIKDVKITLGELPDTYALTNENGEYYLQDLSDGVYTLIASKIDYVFLPAYYPIRLVNTVAEGINFTGKKENGFKLGGVVQDKDKLKGISKSLVFLLPAGLRVETDQNGEFLFKNLPSGKYLVRVVDSRYAFDVSEQEVSIIDQSVLDIKFSGTKKDYPLGSINGAIVDVNGTYVQYIRTTLTPTNQLSITNEKGMLEFTNCQDGSYVVTPNSGIMSFVPLVREVSLAGNFVSGVDFVAVPDLPSFGSISGKTLDKNNATPVENTTVYLDMGSSQIWTTTNEKGEYKFENLKPFTYSVFARMPGYSWEPNNHTVYINGTNEDNKNFAGTYFSGKYGIYGNVVDENSNPCPNVTVTLYPLLKTTKTDSNGDYSFLKVHAGSYYVAINEPNYTYQPQAIDVVMENSDVKDINFQRTLGNGGIYTIQGFIKKQNGEPLDKIMVYLSTNKDLLYTYTNNTGEYTFSNLTSGDYIVEPTSSSYNFNPVYKIVTVTNSDKKNNDFIGQPKGFSISGWVFEANKLPLNNTVVVLNPGFLTYTTSSSGYFIFNNLPQGLYELTPFAEDYRFAPINRFVEIKSSDVTNQNFIGERGNGGQFSISGVFYEKDTYSWIAGQKLTLLPDKYIRYTELDGSFLFVGLLPGTYKIVYESYSYDYDPKEIEVTITDSNIKKIYVEGTPGLGTVSGFVFEKDGTPCVSCPVIMQPGDFKTYTNIKGLYKFEKIKPGKYTVKPTLTSYTFTPEATEITSNDNDLKNINFKAN